MPHTFDLRELGTNHHLSMLTLEQQGILLRLLSHGWSPPNDGWIPDDDRTISDRLRLPGGVWQELKPVLLDAGVLISNGIHLQLPQVSAIHPAPAVTPEPDLFGDFPPSPTLTHREWDRHFGEVFWPAVWLKRDKHNARKAWAQLKPRTVAEGQQLLDAIMTGVREYTAFLRRNPDHAVKYPQGWLSGRRWEDEHGHGQEQNADRCNAVERVKRAVRDRRTHQEPIEAEYQIEPGHP